MFINNLVIGSTAEANLFCFNTPNTGLVRNVENTIFPYEEVDFSIFGTRNKQKIYSKLCLMNSLLGKILLTNVPDRITIQDKKCIMVSKNTKYIIEYENCYIFDSSNTNLVPIGALEDRTPKRVIDYFEVKNVLKNYDFSKIETGDDLVSSIWPHNSGRVLGSKYVTEFYTESTIKNCDLQKFEFSETMCKFKLLDDLKTKSSFRGTFSNYLPDGSKKYSNLILDHIERVIVPSPVPCNSENGIEFVRLNLKEIFYGKEERKSQN